MVFNKDPLVVFQEANKPLLLLPAKVSGEMKRKKLLWFLICSQMLYILANNYSVQPQNNKYELNRNQHLGLASSSYIIVIFFHSQGDPVEYYEDGAWFQAIKAKFPSSKTVVYPDQNHGFVPRGDITNADTQEAVDSALAEIFAFFAAHFV